MKPLYIPKGKAREYGDYAVNISASGAALTTTSRIPCERKWRGDYEGSIL